MDLKVIIVSIIALAGLRSEASLSSTYLPPRVGPSSPMYGGFAPSPHYPQRLTNHYIPPEVKHNQRYYGVSTGKSQHLRRPQSQYAPQMSPLNSPIAILHSENINNGDGTYHFSFETANGIRRQESGHLRNPNSVHPEQVVMGSYTYTGDDGVEYTVYYTADSEGFRVQGKHLPTPPPVPQEIQNSLSQAPRPTQFNQKHLAAQYSSGGASSYTSGLSNHYLPPTPSAHTHSW